jgi:transposase
VLEAADGFGTREIARELDTTPTTVSLWRGRLARQRLDGLKDLPRSGTPPIYSEATDKRIRAVLDRPPPKGFARWNGPLIAKALGDVDVQYVWRSLRKHKIDLGGRKSWCESNEPKFASAAAEVGDHTGQLLDCARRRSEVGAPQMAAAEHVQRQIAVAIVMVTSALASSPAIWLRP